MNADEIDKTERNEEGMEVEEQVGHSTLLQNCNLDDRLDVQN